MAWLLLAGGAVILALVAGTVLMPVRARRKVEALLATRPQLDDTEFGRRFFGPDAQQQSIAIRIRTILAQGFRLDLGGLEPTDELQRTLLLDTLDSLQVVEFVMALEEAFGIKIPDRDAPLLNTFGDVVSYISGRLGRGLAIGSQGSRKEP